MTTKKRVFDAWKDQPLKEVLFQCREAIDEADFTMVDRWREQDGKVAGHFQVYFPAEIAHAAGMLPVKMAGAPVEPNNSDSRFGSYLCSVIKTSLELSLSGKVVLDMFVSHPICDAARNLAAIWGRNHDYPCQILYLPQNPNSTGSATYLSDEFTRLKRVAEQVSGNTFNDEDLQTSIGLYNRSRALVRDLYQIKRNAPWKLAAEDGYALVAIGGRIPVEEHIELLEFVLPLIEARTAKAEDRIRVVFEGAFCEQPPLDLIRMVGRSCYIVDDDFLIGLRWVLEDIPTDTEPLMALAEAYLERSSYSPVQHDNRKPKEKMLVKRFQDADAGAVVLTAAKMCEPGLEEQVAYVIELDSLKVPYFLSEFEENMTNFGSLELQVETFVENLLFG